MNTLKRIALSLGTLAVVQAPQSVFADTTAYMTVGAGGYDLVAYHTAKKPVRGNGNHVVVHDGITYLFADEENKDAFEAKPQSYLPAFGGYCAYGVAVGKKFYGDPEVWKIVDGRLYLNLDKNIQAKWQEDVPGNIEEANGNWPEIKDRLPSEL